MTTVYKLYERKGLKPTNGDDGKPMRIRVSSYGKAGTQVWVERDNFEYDYQGIGHGGRSMKISTLDRDWNPIKSAKTPPSHRVSAGPFAPMTSPS